MIEQRVADRFRDAVADEPPMGFDPDDVIDRAIKRSRRRKVIWAVAAATCVEAAVVWAVAGPSGGGGQLPAAGRNPGPAPAEQPATAAYRMTGFETTLTLDNPGQLGPPNSELLINDLLARNPDGDEGTLRLRRGDEVVFEIDLAHFHEYDLHYTEPVKAEVGVPVMLTVNCTASQHGCRGVSLTVSGNAVQQLR